MPGEKFHVRLVPEEGGPAERVVAEVGLDGFNILTSDGSRAVRKYPLHHISRWSMRGSSLILFTKSPVDLEDRTVTLQGDERTVCSVLDTLTCSCMQMAELLQDDAGADRAAANSLAALLKKSKKPAAALPTADQVEFWKSPEKAGWMYSQGEHIRTWRKRWFVLKQGFLFRFASPEVVPASKPRGVVDLSSVTDVSDGAAATGRPNSIKLSTSTGSKCYLAESETAQVEWVSALEGAVARLMKIIAGVDDEGERPAVGGGVGGGGAAGGAAVRSLAEQLQRSYTAASGTTSAAGAGPSRGGGGGGNGMVRIVNYDAGPSAPPASRVPASQASGAYSGDYGGHINIDYGSVAGAQMAPPELAPAAGGSGGSYGSIYQQQQPAQAPAPGMSSFSGVYGQQAAPPQYHQPQPLYQQYDYAAQAPAEYSSAPQQQQQGHGYGGVSLLDAVTAPQAPPPAPSTPWQVHYTADGRPYYYNTASGLTSWEQPAA